MIKKTVIFIMSLLITISMCGCIRIEYRNLKADDTISRAIYEKMKGKVYYQGRDEDLIGGIWYSYIICTESEEIFNQLRNVVNEVIDDEYVSTNINVICYKKINGGLEHVLNFSNYLNKEGNVVNYNSLQRLVLFGDEIEKSEFYSNPATYKNIEGIRYLEVSHYMQKMANINNIDWNEYWPELESITLLEY